MHEKSGSKLKRTLARGRLPLLFGVLLVLVGLGLFWGVGAYYRHAVNAAIRSGELGRAEALARGASRWNLDRGLHLFHRGRVARLRGQGPACKRFLDRAANSGYDPIRVELERQLLAAQSGRAAQMLSRFGRLLDDASPYGDAPFVCDAFVAGLVAARQFPTALQTIELWLQGSPGDARAYVWKGQVLEEQGQMAEAEAAYRDAVSLEANATTHAALANILRHREKWSEAELHYRRALALGSDEVADRLGLASTLLESEQWEQTETVLDAVIDSHPELYHARLLSAELAARQQRFEEVVSLLVPLLERFPEDAQVLRLLAQAHRALGNGTRADELQQRVEAADAELAVAERVADVAALRAEDAEVRFRIAQIYAAHRWQAAFPWAQATLVADPQHAGGHRLLAEFHVRNGDPERANDHRTIARQIERRRRAAASAVPGMPSPAP